MELTELIANLGFPIALSIWFMFKLEKVINNNTSALIENSVVLKDLKKGLNNKK